MLSAFKEFVEAVEGSPGAAKKAAASPAQAGGTPSQSAEAQTCPDYKAPPATSGKKLWVVGNWEKPAKWSRSPRAEAYDAYHAENGDRWAPSVEDFRAGVPKVPAIVSTRAELHELIRRQGKNGIAELNIIGHGHEDGLYLNGKMTPLIGQKKGNVIVDFTGFEASQIGILAFEPSSRQGGKFKQYFAPGAEVNLLACHLAVSPEVPEEIAKDLCVAVNAPGTNITYCPTLDGIITGEGKNRQESLRGISDRRLMAVGASGSSDDLSKEELCKGRQPGFVSIMKGLHHYKPPSAAPKEPIPAAPKPPGRDVPFDPTTE